MRVVLEKNGEVDVHFQRSKNAPNSTLCTIKKVAEGKPTEWVMLAAGASVCGEKDTFVKKIGQKVALSRAIDNYSYNFPSLEDRRRIWRTFKYIHNL